MQLASILPFLAPSTGLDGWRERERESRRNVNGTARSISRIAPFSQAARNVLQSGDAEGNCVALARQSPKTAAVGPKSNSSSLPCSHADSVVCLNVGGRIESKIVAGAHSGERRHRQSRGEESLQEFKPVSEWWDEIGAGKEEGAWRFGVVFC